TKYFLVFYASMLWLTKCKEKGRDPLYRVAKDILDKFFPLISGCFGTETEKNEKNNRYSTTFLRFYIAF
ncbi:MAG: hypothetical protein U0K65_04180, partial [Negativibacillus sp.]|nr:hypothetical protein [Negativibacillus sp.]